ncbi:NADP-dependent 3-hydroxy acid dehydrogenase YdfG [Raineyella antarctica]|uniref:NADP-dependent 3-hydroxy acid dehydrogenase YdfG n=1 Tax=Raineyella antarctica TaxID=1577474 RepID=A0A1G6H6W2_9ACTN|nr:SDR family oxidoreductase [Raineyella antarctica]SDB90010.1 NADP-dependent 3-hydroxy acid dehydrogenase YdfG [Raineyella antarctica]
MDRPVALITGGSRGIGRAIADALADTHHLLIGGRDAAAVTAVVSQLPSAEPFVADLTDEAATEAAVRGIDRLDVLVHSAGRDAPRHIEDMTRADWRDLMEANVIAVADLTRLLLPALRAANGLVVMINSGAGLRVVGSPAYSASKYALRALADGLREDERGRIRVTTIYPGRVDTDMQRHLQAAAGRGYNPEEHLRPESVARVVRTAVDASPEGMVEEIMVRPIPRVPKG